ncbi:helix-turn-helix transcriptional regulator [Chitinimonas sp. PSY-7]|uniref:LuxR C-terminal-related transcriptional regulator n=1 Tax=Chitinimonas sp. PSY-7 TaxID=3459088 RepID=UPI0040400DB4
MTQTSLFLVTHDVGLANHWQTALAGYSITLIRQFSELVTHEMPAGAVVWVDADLPDLPAWNAEVWSCLRLSARLILASSNPSREVAIAALGQGAAAYCHAYANAETLRQVLEVVLGGNIWIGRELMQQLLSTVQSVVPKASLQSPDWMKGLTEREQEVARLAANGASNREIATQCNITERTVKAHLAATFTKLGVSDRLQLALRVHGIR